MTLEMNDSIIFDDFNKQFEILDGTKGVYNYSDVLRVCICNEKANRRGKGPPFTAVLPNGPLPAGIFSYPYLFVGIKITLKNNTVLGLYISKNRTMLNTDQYNTDKNHAKIVLKKFNTIIEQKKVV